MFLRIVKVNKGNRTYKYLRLVQNTRKKGKTIQKVIVNFGNINYWSSEKTRDLINKLAEHFDIDTGLTANDIDPQGSFCYGPFLLADCLWKRLEMSAFLEKVLRERGFDFEVEMAIKVMVFNRLCEPTSKHSLPFWLRNKYIPGVSSNKIKEHHYYRAMDILEEYKDSLEKWIFWHLTNLFNCKLSLVFYDLTSSYFEGSGPDIASFGYSRDHRPDCEQIQIGLLVNPEGIPIAHTVFNGSISDQKTLPDIVTNMTKKFNIKQCIFVADDGILNNSTAELVKDAGFKSIYSASMRKEKRALEITGELPSINDERWNKIKENLWIYELPKRINNKRVVAAFNPIRKKAQTAKRERRIQKSQNYFSSFNEHTKRGARKNNRKIEEQIEKWLTSKGTKKYFKFKRIGPYNLTYELNKSIVNADTSLDGMMLLYSDADDLSTEDIVRGYRTLTQVEDAFNEIKNFIKVRPIRHYKDYRVKAHVAICVIAYLIESLIGQSIRNAKLKLTARKALYLLRDVSVHRLNLAGKILKKADLPTEIDMKILKSANLQRFDRIVA
jgi:transposase